MAHAPGIAADLAPPLWAVTRRNGVAESVDLIDAIALDAHGSVLAAHGDPDRTFYYRSAIKPVQATVAQELGAAMSPEQLAVAAASHSGYPIHLALVTDMLREVGLGTDALRTTRGWPLETPARDGLVVRGHRKPTSLFHNCSGKHAGFLRACVAQGWPIESYLHHDHPLQRRIGDRIAAVARVDGRPTGVDGCGAPAFRGSARALARVFATLTVDAAFAAVAASMSRFPALVSGPGRPDGILGRWWVAPLKVGAEGVLAAGRHGLGIAVKSRAGSGAIAAVGMVEMMRALGALSTAAMNALGDVASPPVMGGERVQGRIEIEHDPDLTDGDPGSIGAANAYDDPTEAEDGT